MSGRRSLSLLFCIILGAITGRAQNIGQQGTDPFTGKAGNPTSPVSAPSTDDHSSPHASEERVLKFKSEAVIVLVPAVVTDKSGGHIHNLTKKDFKVMENGKQQRISTFEEITASSSRPAQVTNPPGTFSNLPTNGQQPVSITVIALDTINTPFLDQATGRKQLIKYLADTLDSGHSLGLVAISSKGVKVLGGLNSDPASLIAALKKASGELSSMETFGVDGKALAAAEAQPSELTGGIAPGADPGSRLQQFILNADAVEGQYQQQRAIEDTMKAFLAIAKSLSGIPGRKSLIWATGSFPFSLDSPSAVPGGNLSLLYERTLQALNDAQVSVYPLDVRGLVGTSPMADATYSGDLSGPGFADAVAGRSALQTSTIASLKNFAEMTGGRAYYNNNDLAAGFKRAADDSSSYYLLGYYADHHDTRPGWRKLQVQVSRPDVEVHARTGFLVTNATIDPELTRKADVDFALSSPFDSTGIPVTIEWQPAVPDGDRKKIAFALRVPANSVIDEADNNRFDIDFVAQTTKTGAAPANAAQTVKGAVPESALDKIKAEGIFYKNALELPPGAYQVRFVVRNNLSGRIGSVSAPLTVNYR
ncbi:MAG TPA: VWA domain-containing protein [Terriglobales bacterium]|nr:VWA domain-containing protein [Terriglobales bacterium]